MTLKKYVNKYNLQYMVTWIIYYAWVIVFTTWWVSSPTTDNIITNNSKILIHSLNLISSAVFVFILKPGWFKKSSCIGGILVLFSSVLIMLKMNDTLHLLAIIFLSISLGLLNISILIPMIYVLNSSQQLISIAVANLLLSVLIYMQETMILTINNGITFSFVMLLLSILPIIYFKSDDLQSQNINLTKDKKLNKLMFFSIVLNCIYAILCKGMGKAFVVIVIENLNLSLNPIYYVGSIIGCFLSYLVNKIGKFGNYASWNIVYGLFIFSMYLYSHAYNSFMYYVFAFSMGMVSSIGMINMYYGLSSIGKKYSNYLYVKLSILFIGIFGGISGVFFGNVFSNLDKNNISEMLSIFGFAVIIILLVISPSLYQSYYNDEVTKKEREEDRIKVNLKLYKLTCREEELCKILIEGNTLRQASVMMKISYYTANNYYKNIYKKLGINSKIELINLFKK